MLCYFEGLTHERRPSRLGCPLGTVKGRLSRARDLLRRRLTRRGVTLSVGRACFAASRLARQAAVPASLQHGDIRAARGDRLPSRRIARARLACLDTRRLH